MSNFKDRKDREVIYIKGIDPDADIVIVDDNGLFWGGINELYYIKKPVSLFVAKTTQRRQINERIHN